MKYHLYIVKYHLYMERGECRWNSTRIHRSSLLKWLNSLYRPAVPEGIRRDAGPAAFQPAIGASPSGKAVDFDSTIRRFESSRPSQHLVNEIRQFLNLPDFHSDRPPRPGVSRPRLRKRNAASVQKRAKNLDWPDAELHFIEMTRATCDGYPFGKRPDDSRSQNRKAYRTKRSHGRIAPRSRHPSGARASRRCLPRECRVARRQSWSAIEPYLPFGVLPGVERSDCGFPADQLRRPTAG